ncbi:MAG: methyl-accepting chemotaxis protein, partial [Tissierellaceae bacterium]|nr:methyl-accepting chemotaxis protein [Tissierellaceae bacterium]
LLLVGIPSILAYKYAPSTVALPLILALSGLVPFLVAKGLFRPIKSIEESIDRIVNKDLSLAEGIVTNDFFENITKKIGLMKDSIKTDFVGYKATTDELNVFTNDFLEISENMSFTSNEISNVVEQVATGIVSQAEETSGAAEKLNDSINSLEKVVAGGNQGKERLEAAAMQVSDGFDELNTTSGSLSNILTEFSQVRVKGQQLQNRANEVRNIVETVEKIAEQTNLLALNASIEASRAGEYGRGFAVVAMEIRNLAEGSKEAVQTINTNLESFVENIDEFVQDISDQYNILEGENNKLSSIAVESHRSVESINEVSRLIIGLTRELNDNARDISSISDGIAMLASIAEENSASSEEVSANVHSYTNEIRKMTDGILEFQRVSNDFSKDLEKFIV